MPPGTAYSHGFYRVPIGEMDHQYRVPADMEDRFRVDSTKQVQVRPQQTRLNWSRFSYSSFANKRNMLPKNPFPHGYYRVPIGEMDHQYHARADTQDRFRSDPIQIVRVRSPQTALSWSKLSHGSFAKKKKLLITEPQKKTTPRHALPNIMALSLSETVPKGQNLKNRQVKPFKDSKNFSLHTSARKA